jgi:transposase
MRRSRADHRGNERLVAWFQNFRRLVVRYERYAENFLAMLHLAYCLILLRGL